MGASSEPDPDHIALWRDPVLYEHFLEVAPLAFRIRPPLLDEVLTELTLLGEYTLAVHDEEDDRSVLVREHVCTLRFRGAEPEDAFLCIAASSPTVAALRVLRSALVHMQRQGEWVADDFEQFLEANS